MGSCVSNRKKIIVSMINNDKSNYCSFYFQRNKNTSETIQTSSASITRLSKIKNKWNSQIKVKPDLSMLLRSNSSLVLKANTISPTIKVKVTHFKEDRKHKNSLQLKEYLYTTPNHFLLCPLCDDILINPFHCVKCNLFICSHCADETYNIICAHDKDDKPNKYYRVIQNALNEELFRCFNHSFGCDISIPYNSFYFDKDKNQIYSSHENECEFHSDIQQCPYPSCNFQSSLPQLKRHIYHCPYKQFHCLSCDSILSNGDLSSHQCGSKKIIPLRFCRCGTQLQWGYLTPKEIRCYNERCCSKESYYYCSECSKEICEHHAPPPISKLCGCGQKLKGGLISKCSVCGVEGGIGWYCNVCDNGERLCEGCLDEKNETI